MVSTSGVGVMIAEMMKILYEKANTSVPLIHNKVYLGIPDVENTTSLDGSRLIRPLLDSAGLDYLRYRRQSQLSILHLYGLDNCFGIWLDEFTEVPNEECEKYWGRLIRSVLFIHLDESSLNLRFLIREDGLFPDYLGSPRLLWVDEGVDTGPIIVQETVPVHADDDEGSLRARIQAAEKPLYLEAIRRLCNEITEISI